MVLLAPVLEEAAVAERDVLCRIDAQVGGGAVNPFGGAFQLGIVADGGLIDHAMSLAVGPLSAPLFITKRRNQAEREEDLLQRRAVRDLALALHAMLVPLLAREIGRA